MTGLASWWITAGLLGASILAAPIPCAATVACTQIEVRGRIQAAKASLTLADLLANEGCAELRQAAAQVRLGAMPRNGSVRVLDGGEVRRRFAELTEGKRSPAQTLSMNIPARILVESAEATKSCAEIAQFVSRISAVRSPSETAGSKGGWEDLNCAAARHIPEVATLELTEKRWRATNQRWEFTLRCAHPSDCVPFLVWAHGEGAQAANLVAAAKSPELRVPQLIKAGQTASLTWDERGIRIVAPVTCMDSGGVGQSVRVRFKNGPGVLRAEVLSDGTLRASL